MRSHRARCGGEGTWVSLVAFEILMRFGHGSARECTGCCGIEQWLVGNLMAQP